MEAETEFTMIDQGCTSASQVLVACPAHISKKPSMLAGDDSIGCETFGSLGFLEFLENGRDVLANYQENQGFPKHEQFGFISLMGSLIQYSYCAIVAIFTMIYNLLPLLHGFLYLTRFILDKIIEISQANGPKEMGIKTGLFIFELTIIILTIMIMCAFIVFPVCYLLSNIADQIMNVLT